MILNLFSVAVGAAGSTAILAISDLVDDSEKLGAMSFKAFLCLLIIILVGVVLYVNHKREKELEADRQASLEQHSREREAHKKAHEDLLAHHNAAVITMNAEREEFRKGMAEMVKNNTAAMTQLTDAIQNLR